MSWVLPTTCLLVIKLVQSFVIMRLHCRASYQMTLHNKRCNLVTSWLGSVQANSELGTIDVVLQGQLQGVAAVGHLLGQLHRCGAEPSLASEAWVRNHLRWVLWKLAAYEQAWQDKLKGKLLVEAVVLDELKLR